MNFQETWDKIKHFQFGLWETEADQLFKLASSVEGLIVEIGSMWGGSACLLEQSTNPVVCVDPFENQDCYEKFLSNTQGSELISVIRKPDNEVWGAWEKGEIVLLFIDHDHKYQSTLDSLLNWKPLLAPNAIVCIHDYDDVIHREVKPAVVDSGLLIDGIEQRLAWGHWGHEANLG